MREGLRKVGRWLAAAAILTLSNGFAIGLVRPDAAVIAGALTADIVAGALVILVSAAAVALLVMDFGDKWLRARRRAHVTPGRVIGRSLESRVAENVTVHGAVVHVRYEVRGTQRELEWKPSSTTISIPWVVEYFLERRYPDGKELRVYYEWEDPKNAWVGRAWSVRLLTVPLVIAVLGYILALGYVSGSALRCATDRFLPSSWRHSTELASGVSPPVEQAAPVGVSTNSRATLTAEGALRGPVKNGILSIPVGKAKSLQLRAGDGSVRGAGAGK